MKTISAIFLLCLASFLGPEVAAQSSPPGSPAAEPSPSGSAAEGVPVTLDGETLFHVHEALGPFSPQDRAGAAGIRIRYLAEDPFYSDDLFAINDTSDKTEVLYGEKIVAVVLEKDAVGEKLTRTELASQLVQTVKGAIARYRERRVPAQRIRAFVLAGVATLLLVALLFLLGRVHRRLVARVEAHRPDDLATRLDRTLAIRADQIRSLQIKGLLLLWISLTVLALAVYLEVAFSVMPSTRGYAFSLFRYAVDPLRSLWTGFLLKLGDIFALAVLIVLTRMLLRILRGMATAAASGYVRVPGVQPEWAFSLYKIVRLAVVAMCAVMMYPYIPGSNTEAFKGIGIFAGALFTLGATGMASNFMGGLVVIFSGTFRLGDRVAVGGVTGDVVESTLLITRVLTPKNEVVTVPNSSVLSGHVVNYSARARADGLILHTEVTIGYDAAWRRVHELLIRAALATPRIERDPAPFVLQTALNDFFVTYQINAYTRDANAMVATYGELHQSIQDTFNEGGVEIMSPHYTSVRDGNTVTIPEPDRPPGYEPRPFTVQVKGLRSVADRAIPEDPG